MTTSTSIQPSDALIGGACHFLAIPAEVRLQIYLLLLLFSSPIDIGRRGCYTIMRAIWDHAKLTKNCAAILFCCKHIRSEALPIFYGRNSFSIMLSTDIPRYLASRYSNFLKLSLIRHLVVHVKFSSQYNNIMDETRAEEMKCFVGLQRLTVIRTRIYPERCDGFTQLAIDEVVQGTASKGLKAILIERPSITCRLITVNDVQGSPFRVSQQWQ